MRKKIIASTAPVVSLPHFFFHSAFKCYAQFQASQRDISHRSGWIKSAFTFSVSTGSQSQLRSAADIFPQTAKTMTCTKDARHVNCSCNFLSSTKAQQCVQEWTSSSQVKDISAAAKRMKWPVTHSPPIYPHPFLLVSPSGTAPNLYKQILGHKTYLSVLSVQNLTLYG